MHTLRFFFVASTISVSCTVDESSVCDPSDEKEISFQEAGDVSGEWLPKDGKGDGFYIDAGKRPRWFLKVAVGGQPVPKTDGPPGDDTEFGCGYGKLPLVPGEPNLDVGPAHATIMSSELKQFQVEDEFGRIEYNLFRSPKAGVRSGSEPLIFEFNWNLNANELLLRESTELYTREFELVRTTVP